MARKGNGGINLLVGAAIAVAIIVIVIYFVRNGAITWGRVEICKDMGYTCRTKAPDGGGCLGGERTAAESWKGCSEGQICCAKIDPSAGGGGTPVTPVIPVAETCNDKLMNQGEKGVDCGGPCLRTCVQCTTADQSRTCRAGEICKEGVCVVSSGTGSTPTAVKSPDAPTINYFIAKTETAAPRDVPILSGTQNGQTLTYRIETRFGYHRCSSDAAELKKQRERGAVCPQDYELKLTFKTPRETLKSFKSKLEPTTGSPEAFRLEPDYAVVIASTSNILAVDSSVERAKDLKVVPTSQGDEIEYKTFVNYVTVTFSEKELAQRYQLTANLVPDVTLGKPGLQKSESIFFTVSSPIRISGIAPQITKKKDVSIACVSPLKCTNLYFQLTDTTTCPQNPALNKDSIPSADIEYCKIDGQSATSTCYRSNDECRASITSTSDATYALALKQIQDAFGNKADLSTVGLFFNNAQSGSNIPQCFQRTKGIAGTGPFRIVTFNPDTQRATVTIDYAQAANKYMCVYGVDANDKKYVAVSSQKLLLDLNPPKVTTKFNPLSLVVSATCTDGDTLATPVAGTSLNSGCKSTIGYTYISDLYSYSQALFRGPGNAALLCPPFQSSSNGYVTHPYYDISTANSNEVRVMCVRVEDNAGNAAVSMITVYNSYDMLAKSLAAAAQAAR
jgi:hypothetical protein